MRFKWRRKCSFCGKEGHNWRTCPASRSYGREDVQRERQDQYTREEVDMGIRCGRCGTRGHTRAECPRGRTR